MEFGSLEAFATHLAGVVIREQTAERIALTAAARIVKTEAKSELGAYQDEIGDLVGWAELADSTKSDRVAQGYTENDPGLRSGAMRDSIKFVVMEGEEWGEHVAFVGSDMDEAVWFELGTSKQPPRSFLAGAAMRKEDEIHKIVGKAVHAAIIGEMVHEGMLALDGGSSD